MAGKIYRYDYRGDIIKKPQNIHLLVELTSGNIIEVDSANNTKIYHLNTTTRVETQLDVDPSDSSGDNKSRDQKVQALWHDRDNQIIWGVDCDNPGDNFDVWKLDYSVSETSPTVIEIGTCVGHDAGTVYTYDIFIIGTNTYVNCDSKIGGNFTLSMWDVDTAPFTLKDSEIGVGRIIVGYGIVIGTLYYFCQDPLTSDNVRIIGYNSVTAEYTFGFDPLLGDYSFPAARNMRGLAYDGSDLIYGIVLKISDGKNYLFSYSIGGDIITLLVEYSIALMLDRNTDTSNESPLNIEKAFHITSYFIYRIRRGRGGIWKIYDLNNADTPPTDVIIAITDTYLITNDGKLYKYIDFC